MALALGDVELPGIEVPYRLADGTAGKLTTEPVRLRVESVLPKDPKQQKLADIRGPLALSIGAPFWIALAVATALIGALAFWLWRRRRPAASPAAAPPVEPDAEALSALDRLAGAGLVERHVPAIGAIAVHEPQVMPRERDPLVAARRLGAARHEREAHEMVRQRDECIGVLPRERVQRPAERVHRGSPVGILPRRARLRVHESGPRRQAAGGAGEIDAVGREERLDPVTPRR
jgi:hypothetical protein